VYLISCLFRITFLHWLSTSKFILKQLLYIFTVVQYESITTHISAVFADTPITLCFPTDGNLMVARHTDIIYHRSNFLISGLSTLLLVD
jgi:hypothetical protein